MKKTVAFVLCTVLAAALGFTGCGDKKTKYSYNGDSESTEERNSALATDLGIPDSYEGEIDTGDSGLTGIKIDTDSIIVPAGDSMSYVTCTKCANENDFKKLVCEVIYDDAGEIYVYDEDHQVAEDVQTQIDCYEKLYESAVSLNNANGEYVYQNQIDELELLMEAAMDEPEPADDYSADSYLGYINGEKYLLEFVTLDDQYGNEWLWFYIEYYPHVNLINYRPYEDGEILTWATVSGDNDENLCLKEDAEETALNLVEGMGLGNLTIYETSNVEWQYLDSLRSFKYYEQDGYKMCLTRDIAGETALVVGTYTGAWESFNEEYEITVDSTGLIDLSAEFVLTYESEEENVELISWEEVLQALNDGAGDYFAEEGEEGEVVLDDVRLAYMLLEDPDDSDIYRYTPVWYFAESSEYDNDEKLYPENVIIINAMDGTVYDFDDVFKN